VRETNALIIMWPVNVRWDRGGVIEMMWLAKMDLVLTQWQLDTDGEHTYREARYDLLHTSQV
jgi:hypothetical protein